MTSVRSAAALVAAALLCQVPAGAQAPAAGSKGSTVTRASFGSTPDGKAVAYYVHAEDSTHIWMTDIATNKPVQVTKTPVLATLVTTFEFTQDGKQIATVLIPDGRSPMPVAPASPTGPVVKIADSEKNRLRTFPSLMTTPYEQTLLEWHSTGQLAFIDVATRAIKKIGQPAMIRSIDPSPDAKYVRVTRMVRPFSYDVPVSNFGSIEGDNAAAYRYTEARLTRVAMEMLTDSGVGAPSSSNGWRPSSCHSRRQSVSSAATPNTIPST